MVKLPIVGRVMSLVRKDPPKRISGARDERLRRGLEHAPAGVAFASPDGHWLQLNEQLRTMLGYTREELARITFHSITHPEDAKKEASMIRRVMSGDTDSYRIHKRTMDKSGKYRALRVRASLVRNDAGEPEFFVYFVDADEPRAEARGGGGDIERVSATLVDQMTEVAVIRVDNRGVITGWNAGAQHIFGYEREEMLGKNRRVLYRDADTWKGRPTSEMKRATEGRIEVEDWRVTKSGEHLFVHVTIAPFSPGGETRGFVEVISPPTGGKAIDTKAVIEQLRAEVDKKTRTEESLRSALDELRVVSEETVKELKIMTVALRNEIDRRKALEDELRVANEMLAAPPSVPEEIVVPVDTHEREWHDLAGDTIDLLRRQDSGTLILISGDRQKEIFFESGRIFSCASTDPGLFLTERLIASGVISEEQRALALEIKQETHLALGRILLILGVVDEAQLVEAMRAKIRDEIQQLVTWTDVKWAFVEDDVTALKLVPLRVEVDELLAPPPRAVVASPTAKKYHLEDCISVKRIAKKSRVRFASESEATAKGLSPCRMCVGQFAVRSAQYAGDA